MRHSRGLSDTQELVKRLKENEGNIMLDNEELESALEVANKTALELKENLEFVLNREEELKLEYEDVRGKYKIIKKFFDQKDQELGKLRAEKERLQSRHQAKIEELTQQIIEERDSTKRVESRLEVLQERVLEDQSERSSRLQDYTAEIAKLESELGSQKTKREHFEIERDRLKKQLERMERDKEQWEEENELIMKRNVELEDREAAQHQKRQLLENQIKKLLEDSEDERRKLKCAFKEKLSQRDQRIEKLEETLREHIQEIKETDGRAYEYQQTRLDLQEAQRQRRRLEDEQLQMRDKCSRLQNEKISLEREIHSFEKRQQELKFELKELGRVNQDLHLMNSKLMKRNNKKELYSSASQQEVALQSFEAALKRRCTEVIHWKEAIVELFALAGGSSHDQEELMRRLNVSSRFSQSMAAQEENNEIHEAMSFCHTHLSERSSKSRDIERLAQLVKEESRRYNEVYVRYKREMVQRRKLHNELMALRGGTVRMMLRIRPLLPREPRDARVGYLMPQDHLIRVGGEEYEFDRVFSDSGRQETIYEELSGLVTSALDGYNVSVMCYGQTGSGKTYTLDGCDEYDVPGMKEMALRQILRMVKGRTEGVYEYQLGMSVVEVYNEKIRDLLDLGGVVEISNGEVVGRKIVGVDTLERALKVLRRARVNRSIGITDMNEYSSRSHEVLSLHLKGVNKMLRSQIRGRLNFIDLAGSERVSKTHAQGDRLKEAMHINKSLSALGNVLQALATKGSHIPFRDSKLTHLLKESLETQDAKTLIFMHISPCKEDQLESVSTLKLSTRIKKVERLKKRAESEEDRCVAVNKKPAKKKTVKRGMSSDLPLALETNQWHTGKKI